MKEKVVRLRDNPRARRKGVWPPVFSRRRYIRNSLARGGSLFPHKPRERQIEARSGRVSVYVMLISPVGFQRMRELKKCHKQDIFLTECKIPFARDPSLRE